MNALTAPPAEGQLALQSTGVCLFAARVCGKKNRQARLVFEIAATLLFQLSQVILCFTTKLVLIMPITFANSAADFIHLLQHLFFKPMIKRTSKIRDSHKDLVYFNDFGPGCAVLTPYESRDNHKI